MKLGIGFSGRVLGFFPGRPTKKKFPQGTDVSIILQFSDQDLQAGSKGFERSKTFKYAGSYMEYQNLEFQSSRMEERGGQQYDHGIALECVTWFRIFQSAEEDRT